ncbi:Ig-like domain repeat protein [Edaphobacter bradus]|uniref:Ig-like domain repeat protein n=1 Tax=Edaphobacter bradus TaxID=2259016 RepID=UPI0021DF4AA0|nr:Ig-like domain repeat protein [Edaphobacter bradus]
MSTRLEGHVPGWASSSRDRGAVRPDTELNITFVLSRSPELQAQFEQLLADQQNPNSPRYHQWLTPQQVGEQYGPTQHDLDALREWLVSQGLAVKEVAPSGMFVSVSGSASSVAAALATDFHYFEKSGSLHMSATAEPAIPSALVPVVSSISGLAEAEIRPAHHGEARSISAKTDAGGVHPQATSSNGSHFITPGDFATIFDLKPVYSAGYDGAGQKVAVIGRSRVAASDITEFENKTGLRTNVPNVVIPTSGVDPGTTNDGDQAEATLDVERVIGVAPGAQVDLVVSGTAGNYNGLHIAAQYEVQTLLDPVMNISFGGCEAYNGVSAVALWDALFSQAASEGISVFVSSGDSGAAGCDIGGDLAPVTQFLSINDICSSSYATCVGGTELVDFANPLQYWSSTNGPGLVSALGYIPEGAWNESAMYQSSIGGYPVLSGGGGASVYVPKPLWQTGPGVPADKARDVPDVSFPSAGHDGYYSCFAAAGGDCASNYFIDFAGTSNAAPSMAGVAAILNQKMGGAQGNLNPLLYQVAASNPSAFHDATPASSGIYSCSLGAPSTCNNSTPSAMSLTGGLAGYALTTGYDQATGLGSLDVANFLAAAASISHPGVAATTLAVHGSATTISDTQTATFTATVSWKTSSMPTGTVQFYANGNTLGAPVTVSSGTATTAALPFPSAGTYYITATYSGDSNYAASTAPGFALVVTGLTSATTVSVFNASIPVGTKTTFAATVTGSGSTKPTGNVRFLVLGTNYGDYVATVTLVNGSATTPLLSFPTIGTYTVTAQYQGDAVYSPSNSSALSYAVIRAVSVTHLEGLSYPLSQSIGAGGGGYYVATIGPSITTTTAPSPTGTLQFYVNGLAQGSPFSFSSPQPVIFPSAGTYTVTAAYSGDSYWQPSTSNAISQTVLSQPATFKMTTATQTLSFTAGATTGNSYSVSVTPSLGFLGTVNLACTVSYNGSGAANAPTCTLGNPSISISLNAQSGSSLVTINSVARPVASSRLQSWDRPGAITLCALLWLVPVRRRSWRVLAMAVIALAGLTALPGCGGGGGSSTPSGPSPTTPGSYTVTISATTTATGVSVPAPLTIALTIN